MLMWGVVYASEEKNVYSGGLKLYWTRMCERAEIYLVTQCREAKKKVKIPNVYFFLSPFPCPQILTSCYYITLVIRNSKPCRAPSLPSARNAALGPLASCSERQLQLKVFGVLSFILFPTLLTLILRQMPLAFKSQMRPCDLGFLVSAKVETREKELSQLLSLWAVWMSPPEAQWRVANNFQSSPAVEAVCVDVCVWIFIYVPCTRECMNWRKLLQWRGS